MLCRSIGPVERLLQRVQVGHVDVIDVDAFLGEQRRQLVQQLVRHAGLELDPRAARRAARGRGGACLACRSIMAGSGPLAVRAWRPELTGRAARRGCPSPASCAAGRSARRRRRPGRPASCARRSLPLGKYWRSSPLVFSFDGRCHGLAFSQKYTGMPSAAVISRVQRHLLALVPGQRPAQLRRQRGRTRRSARRGPPRRCAGRAGTARSCTAIARSTRVPIADRLDAPVIRSPSQCPARCAVGGLGGPLIDHRHGGDPVRAALARPAVRPAAPPAGTQRPGRQLAGQAAELGAVDRLVDRLVHDMPRRARPGTRPRSAWLICSGLHRFSSRSCTNCAQHLIAGDLARPRPGPPLHGQLVRGERPVLRRCPGPRLRRSSRLIVDGLRPSLLRDRPHPRPGPAQVRDPHPLILRQIPRRDLPPDRPRADHGSIMQLPAVPGGDRAAVSPPFPGPPVDPDDPARLRIVEALRDQPRELLTLLGLRRRTRPTAPPSQPPNPSSVATTARNRRVKVGPTQAVLARHPAVAQQARSGLPVLRPGQGRSPAGAEASLLRDRPVLPCTPVGTEPR